MSTFAERVGAAALAKFDAFPSKSKPRVYPDGRREWVPMSAIVLAENTESGDEVLSCVAVATGTKCLPVSSIAQCRGTVLHDSHAETLAFRALSRFLLAEMEHVLQWESYTSRWVEFQHPSPGWKKPFTLCTSVSIHMFSTEAPCGDASMGLLIDSKLEEDGEAWPEPASTAPQMHGRGYFSVLGAVRRKPSRGDAEATLSKSCTDKLAVKQITSCLSFPTTLFLQKTPNTYLQSIILPADKYDDEAFARAFGPRGRLHQRIRTGTCTPPDIHYFEIETTPTDTMRFPFEKLTSMEENAPTKAGNVSALWIKRRCEELCINETLVKGVKQGSKQFSESEFKMSAVCRKRMWQQGHRLMDVLRDKQEGLALDGDYMSLLGDALMSRRYRDAKGGTLGKERAAAKTYAMGLLQGWERNTGDDDWGLSDVQPT